MRQIFLDTETTGLSPGSGDRVIEIGCVEFVNRKATGNDFHEYLNPERESSPEALAIHGLSDEFLATKPKFSSVSERLSAYLQGAEVIIHNAKFDVDFLNAEWARVGGPSMAEVAERVVDSVTLARQMFPGKRATLDALCDRFGIDRSARNVHGAYVDAGLLAEVYVALTRGQHNLLGESDGPSTRSSASPLVNLSALQLPVLAANADELVAHEAALVAVAKASGATALWHQLMPAAPIDSQTVA